MRAVVTAAIVVVLFTIGPGVAQTPSAITLENPELGKDATKDSKPMAGANSFAEGQARSLIVSKGYENVSPLVNDRQGIWHGTATKDQNKVDVSVDFKGNVIAR